ncbi:phosphoglycerate mutase 1 [Lucifera butyrica]|uniref:2,3-bisphosphoglycerate-dependent phosphoglycerate mutase n=1 Tax=Lucifera butyrica TaxID=1351585 RepID=A0A498RFZ1_9FIRM|nr:2,3-diphosphoglycerate-dependent phosphoglycerate mutase [Lucifera butyrica]VBB09877.1 phosphoglycerate mutase 1 [Lucifera butyrica]
MKKDNCYKAVFIRHGQSEWNKTNQFTGWTDVDLTEEGRAEAKKAGAALKQAGYHCDLAFTSYLQRAIKTLHLVLGEMDQLWIPEHKSWKLNERHYGALQGLNKTDTARKYGEEQVKVWRRSYDVAPPPLATDDPRFPGRDLRYAQVPPSVLPAAESLRDTEMRVLPYWQEQVAPWIRQGKQVLIVAHGNSLRALAKHIKQISKEDIVDFEIPTGVPLIFEFTADLTVIRDYYLYQEKTT